MVAFTFMGINLGPKQASNTAHDLTELIAGIERHVRLVAHVLGRCEDCGHHNQLPADVRAAAEATLLAVAEALVFAHDEGINQANARHLRDLQAAGIPGAANVAAGAQRATAGTGETAREVDARAQMRREGTAQAACDALSAAIHLCDSIGWTDLLTGGNLLTAKLQAERRRLEILENARV